MADTGEQDDAEADGGTDGTTFLVEHADRLWHAEQANADTLNTRQNFAFSAAALFFGLNLAQIQWYRNPDRAIPSDEMTIAIKLLVLLSLMAFGLAFLSFTEIPRLRLPARLHRMKCRAARSLLHVVQSHARRHAGRTIPAPLRSLAAQLQEVVAMCGSASRSGVHPSMLADVAGRSSHLMALPESFLEDFSGDIEEAAPLVFQRTYVAYLDLVQRNIRKSLRLKRARRWLALGVGTNMCAIILYLIQV